MAAGGPSASAAWKGLAVAIVLQASLHGGRRAEPGNGGRPVLGADPGQRTPGLGSWARPDSRGGGLAAEARLVPAGSRSFPVGGDRSPAGPPAGAPGLRPGGGRIAIGELVLENTKLDVC